MSEVAAAPLLAIVREDPFDPNPPQLVSVRPGETIADFVDRLGFDPIARDFAVAVIDGEEIAPEDWAGFRLTDGCHVSICIAPQGGDDGNKALTTVLTIFVMVASFWVSGGALGPALGNAFIKNTIGANLAGMAVAAVGTLAISALVKPPTGPQQDRINPVYAIDGATNRFAPFEPILLTLGRRRVFPRLAARGFQELVGDDFYYRLVVDWGPIGVALSDIKVGDTPIGAIDGVEMQHRLVESDPHPTLYPAQVFQEAVGATLSDPSDWETRRTIPDATQATIIVAFPFGLGHTNNKGKSEQWAAQVEVRYRSVSGPPGDETFGSWQSPPGNGVSSSRGSVTPGAGRYGYSERKRNQPFYRAITVAFPEAGLWEVSIRRSSPDADMESGTLDDTQFALFESRRPGRPVTREDVAYSVFRFKGTDETSGRIETINGILDRLVPRFDAAFLASGDLSTAGPEQLTAPALSSNMWEQILWLYRNGFEGRRPLTDAEIDWPSFAIAAKNAADEGWTFDHVFEGAAMIADAAEAAAFAGCGRAGFMGNRLTAVVDAPQLAPVAVLSDRKVRNVRAVKRLSRPPHGFRVRFDDAADGYRTREVIVYTGGHTAETASLFETMQVPGIVNWGPLHRIVARNYRNSRLQNRTITAEVLIDDIDAAIRRGAWIGIQTKVVEVGRAAGWIRRVETNGSGDVTAVILDQGVSQTTGDDLVLQWNRQMGEGVSETLSNALPVASPAEDTVSERIEFETPVTGANKPQAGDHYVFGLSGFLRLDCLVDEIEAIDHEWLRLHLVNYAPERFDETGFVLPEYTPAFERPAFIRPPELELVAVAREPAQIVIHFRPKPGERGQVARFLAARALAPDPEDATAAIGAWDALPDLPASARQLVAPGGQAGDAFIYRIAAVAPTGEIGPYLTVEAIEAIETLGPPANVDAEGITELGSGGSERPALRVTADPNEDIELTELVIELRRVALNLSDERLPEESQPPFEAAASVSPAAARAIIRGLPAGARLDVEVFYRGASQAVSPRVRVADVILPDTDVASRVAVIDAAAFAADIQPVILVDELPDPEDYDGPVLVFLKTDENLYRYADGGWTREIAAADISGQLADAQIAALAAAKVTGQLTNDQIAAVAAAKVSGQLTNDQIAAIAAAKVTGQLTNDQIAAVAAAKVSGQLTNDQIAAIAAAKVTGQLTNDQIAAIAAAKVTGQITGTQITDGAISTPKLAAGAVEADKIAANAVVADKVAANAITAAKLAAGSVEAAKIAAGAVVADKIAASAITAEKLAAGSVEAAKIAAGAVVADKIAASAITTAKLAAGAVEADKIAANAVVADKVAANAITAAKLAAGSVEAAKIAAGAVVADKIAASAVTADKISASAVTAAKVATGAIDASKLVVADFTNLVENPHFGEGNTGWVLVGGTTIVNEPANAYRGNWVWKWVTGSGAGINRNNNIFPVVPGQSIFVQAAAKCAAGTTAGTLQIRIRYLAADKSTLAGGASAVNFTNADTSYVLRNVVSTVPAEAVYAWIDILPPNTAPTGTWWVGLVEARRRQSSELIVDGAIVAAKIASGAVETDKLAANSVTAGKVAAAAISTDQLAANAVTTAKLAAGAVVADKISVSQLSAINANVGLLRTATTGARSEIEANQIRVYDASSVLRVRLGVW